MSTKLYRVIAIAVFVALVLTILAAPQVRAECASSGSTIVCTQ